MSRRDYRLLDKNAFFMAAAVLLASLVLFHFTVRAQIKRLKAIKFQIESQEKLLKVRTRQTKRLDILRENLSLMNDYLSETQLCFIDEASSSKFFQSIRKTVSDYDCDLINLAVREKEDIEEPDAKGSGGITEGYQKLPVELSFSGSYTNVIAVIFELMEQPQLIELSDFDISAENLKETGDIQAGLLFRVYSCR
jgi:Tfp pilus assembly protein PilO